VQLGFGKVESMMVAGKEVVDEGQNAENQNNDNDQIAGIDKRFSFKGLLKRGAVQEYVDG
jgi:hypothetical protein